MNKTYSLERKIKYVSGTLIVLGIIYLGNSNETNTYHPLKWKESAIQKEAHIKDINNFYEDLIDSSVADTSLAKILKEDTPFETKERIYNK